MFGHKWLTRIHLKDMFTQLKALIRRIYTHVCVHKMVALTLKELLRNWRWKQEVFTSQGFTVLQVKISLQSKQSNYLLISPLLPMGLGYEIKSYYSVDLSNCIWFSHRKKFMGKKKKRSKSSQNNLKAFLHF